MPEPTETIWAMEPHTNAKHELLRAYLHAWFPILASKNQKIIYYDGFAGPGRYTSGEEGSPTFHGSSPRRREIRGATIAAP